MFSKIKGQGKAISILHRAIVSDKIANSYLFYGPEGVGKCTTALYFGMALNCHSQLEKRPCGLCPSCRKFLSYSHPDLVYVFPSSKLDISLEGEIKSNKILDEYRAYIENKKETPWKEFFFSTGTGIRIGSIRMLEHRINLSPNESIFKIYIIEDADQMTIQAANAFLKTLEEPPTDTVIILTTSKPTSLLPTILSRCQQIPFQPIPKQIIEEMLLESNSLDAVEAKMYARISNGNLEKGLRLASEGRIESRQQTLELLKIIIDMNDIAFLDFSARYKSSKTQNILTEIISHLIIWISDISYYQNNPEEIINLDKTEMLQTLYQMNSNVDEYALDFINFLEDMIRRLEGHVNPQLVITEIYNRLIQHLH